MKKIVNTAENSFKVLIKCGYSTAEASRMSGFTPPPVPRSVIADANEARYDGIVTAEDRLRERLANRQTTDYGVINANRPKESYGCTTRRGVYRRLKYGKGNISRRGWLAKGFSENA